MRIVKLLVRRVARWNHRQHIKDLDYTIGYHERVLVALPGEIRRLHEIRKFHQGQVATLSELKSPVNWRLGRSSVGRRA
jgi:hypothetical protein